MRTTDEVKTLGFSSQIQGAEIPSTLPASFSTLPPTPPSITLADRLKALGLVVLTGTVGIGVVALGRNLWLAKTEETLLPLTETGRDRSQLTPLRDRLPVITLGSNSASPPESFSSLQPESTRSTRSQRSLQATLPRISHGFGTSGPANFSESSEDEVAATSETDAAVSPAEVAALSSTANPSSSDPEAEPPALISSQDSEAQDSEAQDPNASSDKAPLEELSPEVATLLTPPAKASSAPRPAPSDTAVQDVITALLEAPASPATPIAIAPHSLLSKLPAPSLPTVNTETEDQPLESTPSLPPAIAKPAPVITSPPSAPAIGFVSPPALPVTPSISPDASPAIPVAPIINLPEVAAPLLASPPEPNSSKPDSTPSPLTEPTESTSPATTALTIPSASQTGVYVDRIKITGNTRFSQQQLAAVVQKTLAAPSETPLSPAEGTEAKSDSCANSSPDSDPSVFNRNLSLAALVQASEAITQCYLKQGYINSGAYVPAEVINGASPEIRVVEGKVEAINIQKIQRPGFLWLARPLSKNYVRRRLARSIRTPLQIDQLADSVQLLEQDPLIDSISTTLAPGTTTGGSILNVDVKQASPLRTSFSVDNGRSPSVGRLQQQFSLSHFNLLGLGDALQFGYNRSEGSRGWNAGYSLPINAKNGTLSFNYSQNRGEVIEQPFRDLDIKSRSRNYEVALRQPIKQTSTELLALSLRANHYHNEGVFLETFNNGVALPLPGRGSDPNGETNITALRFGQEWLKRGKRDVVSLQSDFSVGINALGATRLDIPPDGRFLSWQGRGFWVHSFAPDTLLSVKSQLQLANRPLVPVEQLSLGGIDTVRGYRTSTLLADNGAFASAELYLPVLRMSKGKSVVQVVPFFDIGRGWNKGDDQPVPNFLMSTGLGLQWKVSDSFRARIDWGIPLVNANQNGQSLKESLFFSVTFTP